ncbi:MAG: IS1380 family transposase [Petrimonas sp.]|jgi:hypothetical protein|nr:IS1380 family transposase [Petrimonas sp.]
MKNIYGIKFDAMKHDFNLEVASAYAGSALIYEYLDKIGFSELVRRRLGIGKANNATYDMDFIVTSLVASYLIGCERIEHLNEFRQDPLLLAYLGVKKLPDPSLYRKDLRRFGKGGLEDLGRILSILAHPILVRNGRVILDIDTTVGTVYGSQEGAAKGYNPTKHGRLSYRSSLIFDGLSRTCLSAEQWSGNVNGSNDNTIEQLDTTIRRLPHGVTVTAIRSDSDYANPNMYTYLEENEIGYAIKLPRNKRLFKQLEKGILWDTRVCSDGVIIQTGSIQYRAESWDRRRRVVVIRKIYPNDSAQTSLLKDEEYQFIVTNLPWSSYDIWVFYNQRANAENFIKESKLGFNIDSISTSDFAANKADLFCRMIAYNLFILFGTEALPEELSNITVRTFRRMFVNVPCVIVNHAGRRIMRLPEDYQYITEWQDIRQNLTGQQAA